METKSTYGAGEEEEIVEYTISDYLYLYEDNDWRSIMYHAIYDFEIDLEHWKKHERISEPLIHIMYVDIEYQFFYIENEGSTLIFSPDKYNWYRYGTRLENRPYFGRIDKFRKFKLPNFK